MQLRHVHQSALFGLMSEFSDIKSAGRHCSCCVNCLRELFVEDCAEDGESAQRGFFLTNGFYTYSAGCMSSSLFIVCVDFT